MLSYLEDPDIQSEMLQLFPKKEEEQGRSGREHMAVFLLQNPELSQDEVRDILNTIALDGSNGATEVKEFLAWISQRPISDPRILADALKLRQIEASVRTHKATEVMVWSIGFEEAPFCLPWNGTIANDVMPPPRPESHADRDAQELRDAALARGPEQLRTEILPSWALDTSLPEDGFAWQVMETDVISLDICTDAQLKTLQQRELRGPPSQAALKRRIKNINAAFFQEVLPTMEKEAALLDLQARRKRDREQEVANYEAAAEAGADITCWLSDSDSGERRWPPQPQVWEDTCVRLHTRSRERLSSSLPSRKIVEVSFVDNAYLLPELKRAICRGSVGKTASILAKGGSLKQVKPCTCTKLLHVVCRLEENDVGTTLKPPSEDVDVEGSCGDKLVATFLSGYAVRLSVSPDFTVLKVKECISQSLGAGSDAHRWLQLLAPDGGELLDVAEIGPGPWFFSAIIINRGSWSAVRIATLLCDAGATPERLDRKDGAGLLHHAAIQGNEALFEVLLERGAFPSPELFVYLCARRGDQRANRHEHCLKALLRGKADPNFALGRRTSPIELALQLCGAPEGSEDHQEGLGLVSLLLGPDTARNHIITAIRKSPHRVWRAVKVAQLDLQSDVDLFTTLVQRDPCKYLDGASDTVRQSADVMLAAVQVDALALKYAHDSLRSNKDFVMKFLEKFPGRVLEVVPWASEEVRACFDVMQAAVRIEGGSLQYVAGSLCMNEDLALAAIKICPRNAFHVSTDLRSSPAFMARAVQVNWQIVFSAPLVVFEEESVLEHLIVQLGSACEDAKNIRDAPDNDGGSAEAEIARRKLLLGVAVAEDLFQVLSACPSAPHSKQQSCAELLKPFFKEQVEMLEWRLRAAHGKMIMCQKLAKDIERSIDSTSSLAGLRASAVQARLAELIGETEARIAAARAAALAKVDSIYSRGTLGDDDHLLWDTFPGFQIERQLTKVLRTSSNKVK